MSTKVDVSFDFRLFHAEVVAILRFADVPVTRLSSTGSSRRVECARMAEQEDAVDSKSTARKGVRVRLSLRAPRHHKGFGR